MQAISSKEYAEMIRKTTDEVINEKQEELDKAYLAGIIYATKHFMATYKMARDRFSNNQSGLTFEALDYLFNNCTSALMGEELDG